MAPSKKSSSNGECVRVMVRIRPLSSKEVQDGREISVIANEDLAEISVLNPNVDANTPPKMFTFDATFSANSSQQHVYDTAATEIVEAVMQGFNGTIFAYGQTGAGKSHTMEGYPEPPSLRGIIPNSFKHIFDKVAVEENKKFLVRASYLEIYNEEIRDLLSKEPKNQLDLKENMDTGVYVKNLTSIKVKDAAEIDHVMQMGKKNRSVGATLMNQTSSRSHSIFTIVVECMSTGIDGNEHLCMGKLNLVDLAGSERQSKTGATGDRLKEAVKINMSLSALGNVISALVDGKTKHVPYRDSKLTRLLESSLGGNTKTVMIANCGPAGYNYEETITTLRYAKRAKEIKNKPKINEDPKDAMLREYTDELIALRAQLLAHGAEYETRIVDGKEVQVPRDYEEVETIVEKVVIEKGISKEQAQMIEKKAQRKKDDIEHRGKKDLEDTAKEMSKAKDSKKEMELKLAEENARHEAWMQDQHALESKLAEMEKKVLVGGEMMDKASRQEDELRKTTMMLQERKRGELQLARELADREESNLMMEEQYNSMQEEAESKTKKLKKVWNKTKEVSSEVKQQDHAFNREREDLLDTIRELSGSIQMENLGSNVFIPDDQLKEIETRAHYDEEEVNWFLPHLESAGNTLHPRSRPASSTGLRRPETSSGRRKSKEWPVNVISPEVAASNQIENPYLVYDDSENGFSLARDGKKSKKKSKRPGSASSVRKKTSSRK